MTGVVIPLLIVAVLAGAAYGRDRDARPLARRLWRTIYWVNLPFFPVLVAHAPIHEVGAAMLAAFATLAVLVTLVELYAHRRFDDSAERAAFSLSATWPNTGWLGPPVVSAVLGAGALPTALLYATAVSAPFNMLVNATLAAAHDRRHVLGILRVSILRNHYLGPTLLGLVGALLEVDVPSGLLDAAEWVVVGGAIPAFFAFGLVLARTSLVPDEAVGAALVFRLAIAPGLLFAVSRLVAVPDAFLIQAGMATGMNVLVISSEHRLPLHGLVSAIFWGTAIVLAGAGAYVLLA